MTHPRSRKGGGESEAREGLASATRADAGASGDDITIDDVIPPRAPRTRVVRLARSELENVDAAPLWLHILVQSESLGFDSYYDFIDKVLCQDFTEQADAHRERVPIGSWLRRFPGIDPYQLLRTATEIFLLTRVGSWSAQNLQGASALEAMLGRSDALDHAFNTGTSDPGDPVGARFGRGVLNPDATFGQIRELLHRFLGDDRNSYIDHILPALNISNTEGGYRVSPFCTLGADPTLPCLLELIWSYWHEEGMLSQTLNAIGRRFQNVRRPGGTSDPLVEFELAPLRPLSNFLWGYVNDEPNRLSVLRRAYEYQHHYGLPLLGRATQGMSPADSRSRFIEAFHELLRRCAIFYQSDDDATVHADGFPVLNALKEVHLILSEGAHNQFRDLPWTARSEMLIEQWFLARPEMRDFLRGRWMMPYPELWMGGVDAMKRLQSWTDTSVLHFRDLGVYGERLLLSIRYYAWMETIDMEIARTWARFFRPEIQGYLHAYRAVTGVDLGALEYADATLPAEHLRRRLAEQRQSNGTLQSGTSRRPAVSAAAVPVPALPAARRPVGNQ